MRWVESRLSAEKMPFSYAWKTLMKEGIHVAGGSDAPIEHPSPLRGIFDAIYRSNTRRKQKAEETKVFRSEECLSFSEALWIYTYEGAYAAGYEDILGEVKPGRVADLLILDKAVLSDPERLHDLKPMTVFVGGEIEFYDRENNSNHNPVKFLKAKNADFLTHPSVAYEETIAHDAPYIPGKGGSFENSRVGDDCDNFVRIGYCSCQLKNVNYCWS
jgi:hypothetical protein